MEYTEDLRNYNVRKYAYEENKHKAYALIFGYCNKIMQNRVEEASDFEIRIRNDPLELLREVKTKMYDPARAKYEFVALTESIARILNTKQEDDEGLVEYTKRFKQAKDILKTTIGEDILHKFIENTKKYKDMSEDEERDIIKKESFNKWITYLFLSNCDQKKYGSLRKNFQMQYSLGNNQYPKMMVKAVDVLTNNQWDTTYKESQKAKQKTKEDNKNRNNNNDNNNKLEEKTETSYAQSGKDKEVICYCCGKKGHYSNNCPKKDDIAKKNWVCKKGMQMFNESIGMENKESIVQNNSKADDDVMPGKKTR